MAVYSVTGRSATRSYTTPSDVTGAARQFPEPRQVGALKLHRDAQDRECQEAGSRWRDHGLVFASKVGTPLDPSHVRRDFRRAIRAADEVKPRRVDAA